MMMSHWKIRMFLAMLVASTILVSCKTLEQDVPQEIGKSVELFAKSFQEQPDFNREATPRPEPPAAREPPAAPPVVVASPVSSPAPAPPPIPESRSEPERELVFTTTNSLIYTKPNTSAKPLGEARRGAKLPVLNVRPEWVQVEYQRGKKGWIARADVVGNLAGSEPMEPIGPPPVAKPQTPVVERQEPQPVVAPAKPVVPEPVIAVVEPPPPPPPPEAPAKTLTLYYFSDLEGKLYPKLPKPDSQEKEKGGFARLAGFVKNRDKESSLFVFTGDALHGDLVANRTRGQVVVKAFNQAALDVMTLGNHEFDFGLDMLKRRLREAHFDVVSANLLDGSNKPLVKPRLLKTIQGIRVGMTGAFNPDDYHRIHPDKTRGWRVAEDSLRAVRDQVNQLRVEGAELILVLSHLGYDRDLALASVPGIDLILGTTAKLAQQQSADTTVGSTRLLRLTEPFGTQIGKMQVKLQNNTVTVVDHVIHAVSPASDALGSPDPELLKYLEDERKGVDDDLSHQIATATADLPAEKNDMRTKWMPIGNVVADAFLEYFAGNAMAALVNGGSIRNGLTKGTISGKQVHELLPFDAYLMVVKLTGADLKTALENGVSQLPGQDGRFLQVAGMEFIVNARQPVGDRVKSVKIGGKPLNPAREYPVVINDFMFLGKDGFDVLKGKEVLLEDTSIQARDVVFNYLRTKKTITPPTDVRIREE